MSDPKVIRIEGNTPLRLDGSCAWRVLSGTVGLFLCRATAADAEHRRFLFSLDSGATVLWQPSAGVEVIVAGIQSSELTAMPMTDAVAVSNGRESVGLWLAAMGADCELADLRAAVDAATPDVRLAILAAAQTRYLEAVVQGDRTRDAAARDRFNERRRLNERATAETLEGLTQIGRGPGARATWIDTPLVSVMRQLGDACGLQIVAPAASSGAPALSAILDASGLRARKVVLGGNWWRHDGEPLVGTIGPDNQPIGLVPFRRRWFRGMGFRALFADAPPRLVDAALAATIAPAASAITPSIVRRPTTGATLRWTFADRGSEFVTAILSGLAVILVGMLTPPATKILFESTIPDGDRSQLLTIGAALIAAAAGGLLFDLARSLSLLRLAARSAARLQLGLWDRLLDQGPSFFRRFTAGDLESRVNAVTQIRAALSVTALSTVIGSVASVANLALLFSYSGPLTLAAVAVAAVSGTVSVISAIRIRRLLAPLQDADGQLRGLLIQLIGAVPKLRTAGAETRAFAQWGRAYGARMRLAQRLRRVGDRSKLLAVVLPPLATAILFWLAADDVFGAQPTLTVGSFVAFSAAFGTFLTGVTTLGNSTELFCSVAAHWHRLQPILEGDPEVQGLRNPPGHLTGRLRMERVTFRYRADGPLILNEVSIEANPGECIALVGPSGSGKSTIVNLLLRFESPSAGAIYLDDHDLKGLDILAVRQQMGVVSQENKILAGSIYDNITVGYAATTDQVWEAARAAGVDDEIRQMPMGLHTFVSEGGTNLSGGQRQRLLIARVLLRKPALLILDEATSALDNKSQAIVTESLNQSKATRVVIAHRMSTIRQADRIYVIEKGRVVQHGTFAALMAEEGLFARLMRRQVA